MTKIEIRSALYEAVKGSARIDFQDLLLLTTQMVREDPVWRAHYQRRYTHVPDR